jgi:hypothetical protein
MAYDETRPAKQERSGTVIRGADGSLYFIRDEILEACKITEEDMKKFVGDLLEKEKETTSSGFTLAGGPIRQSATIAGGLDKSPGLTALHLQAYTTMCPGTMGMVDPTIRVIPGKK